jgi:hypothetical protein
MLSVHVTLGMIVLNEEELIAKTIRQHYNLVDRIVIVEGADPLYPKHRVTADGLSVDRTAENIRDFPDPDKKIRFIQHGWATSNGDQAKCELRNRYAQETPDGLLAVVDADEAYRHDDFREIVATAEAETKIWAWSYPFLHFWHDTTQFITGGYYDVGHIRFWRWEHGMRYRLNHNFPERQGRFAQRFGHHQYHRRIFGHSGGFGIAGPVGYHFGFCKSRQNIRDKTDYYRNRGECVSRPQTIASREAWFDEQLPEGLKLWPFGGQLPEAFAGCTTTLP